MARAEEVAPQYIAANRTGGGQNTADRTRGEQNTRRTEHAENRTGGEQNRRRTERKANDYNLFPIIKVLR